MNSPHQISRRLLLAATTGIAAASGLPTGEAQSQALPASGPRRFPFTLGVSSGHPTDSGVVLWTRLAPDPYALDGGLSGPGASGIPVRWELAKDASFEEVVDRGTVMARAEFAYSVHVTVSGLDENSWYFYRFRAGNHVSRVGRTRTLPGQDQTVDQLTFAVVSCQRFEHGWWTGYRDMQTKGVDLVVHVGDYIYENFYTGTPREAEVPADQRITVKSLEQYRQRHALYRLDPMLQDMHAHAPFVVIPDNHDAVEDGDAARLAQREIGYRALYEHLPLPADALPEGPSMQIFRSFDYGTLARFYLLDTRQFRDHEQVCGSSGIVGSACADVSSPARTMLGAPQEMWLERQLSASSATWNVLTNTVLFAPFDFSSTGQRQIYYASWDGYPANRARVLDQVTRSAARNPVVLSGDWHTHFALDVNDSSGRTVMPEFMVTAMGSNPGFTAAFSGPAVPHNANVRFYEESRGYLLCTVSPDRWRADFITSDCTRKDGRSRIAATRYVDNGNPSMHA
ncbi:alkaline phosphatase D family protein [Saccharopolyspora shandongensis]|uniref:alkaline phosphatase D family protein n=1 Tax=Saccharopolyspora shandongensis TaxID=418495 RepID=UPI003414AEDB